MKIDRENVDAVRAESETPTLMTARDLVAHYHGESIAKELFEEHDETRSPEEGTCGGVADTAKSESTADRTDVTTTSANWVEVAKIYRSLNERYAEDDLEQAAAALRRRDPSLTEAQSIAKAFENDPGLYTAMRRAELRKQGYDVDADIGPNEPPPLDPRLEAAAAELRKADPKLTEAQSVAKALEDDPTLYERSTT